MAWAGHRLPRIASRTDPVRAVLAAAGGALAGAAAIWRGAALVVAARATMGPFLTLAGVIALGALADRLGLFRWLGRAMIPRGASPTWSWAAVLAFTAGVSAVANLDVGVVVALPVALSIADRSATDRGWVAPAIAVTANSASFLLPTSNLTNLLVLSRAPLSVEAYARDSWLAWLLTVGVTIALLAPVLGRHRRGGEAPRALGPDVRIGMVFDLVPMFVASASLRALLGPGVVIRGTFAEQALDGAVIAAVLNNLPAATALRAIGPGGRWAAIIALAIGPNLLLWGSVATLISRRIARQSGADLSARRLSVLGLALVPLEIAAAYVGLRLVGAL